MRGLVLGLALGAVALAGCSKTADNSAANGSSAAPAAAASTAATPAAATSAAAPAAAGPAGPITLAQLPAPTAGQWSRSSSQDGAAATTDTACMDGKPIDPMAGMPVKCAKMNATRTASGGFVVAGDCPNNGIDAKLTLAGEGDFSKSYTTDSTMVMTGGPGGDMTTKNHSVYTYVGPTCSK
jgi:hypothetical protein